MIFFVIIEWYIGGNMNSISTDGINEVINEIIKLSNDLSEEINELENNLSKINSATSQVFNTFKLQNSSKVFNILVFIVNF